MLSERIRSIFEKNDGHYGSIRISKSLEMEGLHVNHKRVARLMRGMGLYAKGTRIRYRQYHRHAGNEERPNLVNQCFTSPAPNKVWLGDITYIGTNEGFLYPAVFLDVFTRRVVGFSTSPRMTEELAMDAFQKAWGMTHPGKGLIVHTDQGSQFTGRRFRSLLKGNDAICSNSRKGNPYDNAMMESFYRTLKRELVSGRKFESREEAKKEVFKFIELYYNSVRMHSALGYASPREFEERHSQINLT